MLCLAVTTLRAGSVAIIGADIHTLGDQGSVRGGTVVIEHGIITAIGTGVPPPPGASVIDGKGKVVTPGLFDAMGRLGLTEISLEASTVDYQRQGRHGNASFDISGAINPGSTLIGVARAEGVTRAMVAPEAWLDDEPGSVSHPISGLGTVISLGSPTRFVVQRAAAMFATLGSPGGSLDGGSRARALTTLDHALIDAADYRDHREAYDQRARRDYSVGKTDLDALGRVLAREIPLVVTVNRASDILAVIELAERHRIRLIVTGAAEGWIVAERLAASATPVILEPLNNLPSSFDALNASLENAARLNSAGVKVAIVQTNSHNVGNVKQMAGNAVARGLPWIAGLRAITVVPAEIYGLAENAGRLLVGNPADLVVWDGDPLEVTSFAETVFIGGQEVSRESRQKLLRDRYLEAPGAFPRAYQNPTGR